MYTFHQYLARNHEHLHNKTVDYCFHQLVLHILCNFCAVTYRPSMFSVLLQLRDLIVENMKISK